MASTCTGLMKVIENLGNSVARVGEEVTRRESSSGGGATNQKSEELINTISPGPRKLNRKIKGVWYEYDDSKENAVARAGKSVGLLDTRPNSAKMMTTKMSKMPSVAKK